MVIVERVLHIIWRETQEVITLFHREGVTTEVLPSFYT